jgi:hypothetical protein
VSKNKMKTHPSRRSMEIAPLHIGEITRRARRERSEMVWRLLQNLFGNRAADQGPIFADNAAKAQCCS